MPACRCLPLVEIFVPVAVDGGGPIRKKDLEPEKQVGKGSIENDKNPRVELEAEDRDRGQYLDTCLILATGKYFIAFEHVVCVYHFCPFVQVARFHSELVRLVRIHASFIPGPIQCCLQAGFVVLNMFDKGENYPYLLHHRAVRHLEADKVKKYNISRKLPCLVKSQLDILPALRK